MEAGRNIHTTFSQACAADMLIDHRVINMMGTFEYKVPLHTSVYLYSSVGKVTILNEDGINGFNVNGKLAFPIRLFQEDILRVDADENILTQLLIIDEY